MMAFNVAKIAFARASLTISLTKSLRVAGPIDIDTVINFLSMLFAEILDIDNSCQPF